MLFKDKVLKLASKIPKGKITTYKEIAKKLGTKAYRAVGSALKSNKRLIEIPCHRVVKSDGSIGRYSGRYKKAYLLKKEGIRIENGKIVDFSKKLLQFQTGCKIRTKCKFKKKHF
jgi:methylated-DNA-[protein]-cysteine S-methyltransferase